MKNILVSLGIFLVLVFGGAQPVMAQQPWTGECVGSDEVGDYGDVATIQGFGCLVANVLNVVLTMFSFVGFGMFVYAAVRLMLSHGQPSDFENAKNTLTYAILGFVLAVSSYVIINIISYFTGIQSFMTIKFLSDDPPATNVE